jgi:ligand-binding sensor domain-containing protein/signal transduction histidine kinase
MMPAPGEAEKLPATIYTTAEGLAHNHVQKIVADARGFVWFATREGLSRFDGYTFTNYGIQDGLPSADVKDLLETRDGVHLVATAGGLARLEAGARRDSREVANVRGALFSVHQISDDPQGRDILALYEDRRGQVWIGTRAGLFRLENAAGEMQFRPVSLGTHRPPRHTPVVSSLREDRFGSLWVGTPPEVRRLWPDGRIDSYKIEADVASMLEDRAGRFWLGTRLNGLLELTLEEGSGRLVTTRVYDQRNGLPAIWINALVEGRDGQLWAGTTAGLIQIATGPAGPPAFRLLSEAQGIRGEVQSVASDRSGNVWLGTHNRGAVKIARSGFSSFGPEDGIRYGVSLMQTRSGDLCFVSGIGVASWGLYCFNGTSFEPITPALTAASFAWGWNETVLNTSSGEWWFATRQGVARFSASLRPHDLNGRSPQVWFSPRHGLPAPVILTLLEDSRGDIWIAGVVEGLRGGLSRWERRTGVFHHYSNQPNLPDLNLYWVSALAEDRAGNIWIGFSAAGGVARYRDGRFDPLDTRALFQSGVRDILLDSSGRIWIASRAGLFRVDDPAAGSPAFRRYTTGDGLSSNEATALVEDANGRLYVGTARGLDRLDPASGRIKHFSVSDGLPLGEISSAALDRRTGHLWFTQSTGVVRLIPTTDRQPAAPPILITAVQVDNEPQPVHPLGERLAQALELGHERNHLRIDFVALGLAPGEDLRYQYRLEGAGGQWSAPSNQRTVNFANLAPGQYRFDVRAVSADGILSAEPAGLSFTIVPPVWQRWWFLALAGSVALALLYLVYRARLARAVEIASMRTRIATDLHDDIGANLTKIAILSEVTRQQIDARGEAGDRLRTIARISRESVASMSDVVWAINPKRDTLRDTIRRMRQHAEDVCAGRGIGLTLAAPDGDPGRRMPIDVRRDFFLIFKEALNNAVRHSACRNLRIEISADETYLHLRLTDDGVGFETGAGSVGNGLTSMRRRAATMGAGLEIVSAPGRGTTVSLSVRCPTRRRLRHPA